MGVVFASTALTVQIPLSGLAGRSYSYWYFPSAAAVTVSESTSSPPIRKLRVTGPSFDAKPVTFTVSPGW